MFEFLNVIPKLPMQDAEVTKQFFHNQLQFDILADYGDYLLFKKGTIEIHFFEHKNLNPLENYGQIYVRLSHIERYYSHLTNKGTAIHPNGKLEQKSWGQIEFSILDPDHNLITFGESL